MLDTSELFWSASIDDIKKGYIYDFLSEQFICLVCGKTFIKGVVYPKGEILFEAERAIREHIREEHSSTFEYMLNMDKKITGLSDVQRNMLDYFYKGLGDNEIAAKVGGSTSTIRNHRFTLRQKEKQAKLFIALMELLEEKKMDSKEDFMTIHKTATMIDERYAITEEENNKVLNQYFPEGLEGKLLGFPKKEKKKLIILKHIINRFDANMKYTEKEVNTILEEIYSDYVTIRRYLIEYGFMDRHRDGSQYWIKI
ncbi:MAG: hypothetical protein K0R09_1090 [Clostridiales bacterium]|jgi:hypothetical protein|nr:hypothetical protein [Clostridiales bacterium]